MHRRGSLTGCNSGEPKDCRVFIQELLFLPPGVTFETSSAFESVAVNIVVFVGKVLRVIVLMTVYATEQGKVSRSSVAFDAIRPFPTVLTVVDREIQIIVRTEAGRHPVQVQRVAGSAIGSEIQCLVVGVQGRVKIRFMARKTVGGDGGENPGCMTFDAIDVVSLFQRKEIVEETLRRPIESIDVVAIDAFPGVARFDMIRGSRGQEILEVTINAFVADAVELQPGFGYMAVVATDLGMGAQQWKAIVLVQFRNVIHQPVFNGMAAGAVGANRHVVQVRVAGNAVGAGLLKNQVFVTQAAVRCGMTAVQRKTGAGMVKSWAGGAIRYLAIPELRRYLPAIGAVAGSAIHFEVFAVWRLPEQRDAQAKAQY